MKAVNVSATFSRSRRVTGMFRPTTTITVRPHMSTPATRTQLKKTINKQKGSLNNYKLSINDVDTFKM